MGPGDLRRSTVLLWTLPIQGTKTAWFSIRNKNRENYGLFSEWPTSGFLLVWHAIKVKLFNPMRKDLILNAEMWHRILGPPSHHISIVCEYPFRKAFQCQMRIPLNPNIENPNSWFPSPMKITHRSRVWICPLHPKFPLFEFEGFSLGITFFFFK